MIESGKSLYVSKSVVLELEWALRGYCKSPPADVLSVLRHLVSMPNVEIEDRVADGFDFSDALHHASCRHCASLATFDDRKFARRAAARSWKPPVTVLSR